MEDLNLENKRGDALGIYKVRGEQLVEIFDDNYNCICYQLDKEDAKQIVEHLTKVFEL